MGKVKSAEAKLDASIRAMEKAQADEVADTRDDLESSYTAYVDAAAKANAAAAASAESSE